MFQPEKILKWRIKVIKLYFIYLFLFQKNEKKKYGHMFLLAEKYFFFDIKQKTAMDKWTCDLVSQSPDICFVIFVNI